MPRSQPSSPRRRYDVLDAPVTRVASLDVPVPFSPPLEDAVLPNAEKISNGAVDAPEH